MRVKLLKKIRNEALSNLYFVGTWSGYWKTSINGITYKSDVVSGFQYVIGDTGTFIQDAILSYCNKLKKK